MTHAAARIGWTANRLGKLREQMEQHQLDAYIVPRFDAHQSEYCAPHDCRLEWISGFSGSAGLALVTRHSAAIFVDGRYTVQVREQTAPEHFDYEHLIDAPLEQWLATKAQASWRVGYDPMLLPSNWVRRFEQGAELSGAVLIGIVDNLVDLIWQDQPAKPMAEISSYSEQFSGEASSSKRARICALLKEKGCDWLVETQPDNIAWLLNVRGGDVDYSPVPHSFLLMDRDGSVDWCVASAKFPQGLDDLGLCDVEAHEADAFVALLEKRVQSGQRVLIDPDYAPFAAVSAVGAVGGDVLLERNPVTLAKAIKNRVECSGMAHACKQDSIAWINTLWWLDQAVAQRAASGAPMTELDVVQRILEERQKIEGFSEPSFTTIAASDANGAMCHYSVNEESNAPLLETSVFLLDSGGQYLFGTTDATRTVCFSDQPEEICKAYSLVLKAHIRFAMLRFPHGMQGHHIDAIAREPLWAHGMDYDHGTGHGVGHRLGVHEGPQKISKLYSPFDLKPGMMVTNEPGYYEAGHFGIRIENIIEIAEAPNGFMHFHDLTLVPIQMCMVDPSYLSDAEIDWLDAYHARVWEEMSDLVEGPQRAWLREHTQPFKRT